MALPTSYTDLTLAAFMQDELKAVATALGWTAAASYDEAVNETVLVYGVTDIVLSTNILKLRALARVQAWHAAAAATAGDFNFQADGGRYDRSQMHEHCQRMLALTELEAEPYLTRASAVVSPIVYPQDPYAPADDDLDEPVWP